MQLLLILYLVAALLVTVYAVYRAFSNKDNWWGVGIIAAVLLLGFGWVIGLVYIFAVDRRRATST